MTADLYDIGYSFGLDEYDWAALVACLRADAGRFLAAHERAALASGWRAGLRDRENYETDMESGAGVIEWEGVPY